MLSLTADSVRMQATARNKQEALSVLCEILVADGLTTPEYLQGLKDRENQSSTYLGQGIAIPHGTPDSRSSIKKTGVRLVHFADGVQWNDAGDVVYLAVVIAAQSDEHLQILQSLTRALNDDVATQIQQATTAEALIEALGASKKPLRLSDALIFTDSLASDVNELYLQAAQLLKKQGVTSSLFLPKHTPTKLSDAVSAVILEEQQGIHQSALAMVASAKQALAVITAEKSVDRAALSQLLDTLMSQSLADAIHQKDTQLILQLLGIQNQANWPSASVVLANEHGLHARPATALAALTKHIDGEIKVAVDAGEYVSAKSLTRLLSLGAIKGQTLKFIAEPDTEAALMLDKVIEAVRSGLGESVSPVVSHDADQASDVSTINNSIGIKPGVRHKAINASQGLAVGGAHIIKPVRYRYPMNAQFPEAEMAKLQEAIAAVKADLQVVIKSAKNPQIAEIFAAHLALLDDDEMLMGVKEGLQEGLSAPAAWHAMIEEMASAQAALANQLLAERAQDLKDIGQKVLSKLVGETQAAPPDAPYVLIKEDLLPSDVANLDPTSVAGIITAVGGSSSHSAIIARALGIPALVGAGQSVLEIENGTSVLLDGGAGWFVVEPSDEMIAECREIQAARREMMRKAALVAKEPAITTDGHRVEVAANLGNVADTANAVASGAEGVGLLRTELVFMSHTQIPDIKTQVADYAQVFEALEGKPLVVRVLDIGGDKALPYLPMAAEENPFLGLRGIRLLLAKPELLRAQLTALIVASEGRDLRIMFPMIGRIEEFFAAKAILDEVLVQYPHDKLQVGIMLEVPSAAVMAHQFAKEVDFFSIGTNDLTQYVLAIDRGHPVISKDADGLHPSILQLIHQAVTAAHREGKWVGVCGELAADPDAVPLLVGLGVDELSMSAKSIAMTKAMIREMQYSQMQALAMQALECQTAEQVRQLVKQP